MQVMLQGLEKNGIRLKRLHSSLCICVVLLFHILTQTRWKWTLPLFSGAEVNKQTKFQG